MDDTLNLQEILDELDTNNFQEDEHGNLLTISVDRLRAIVSTGEDYRKALYAKNVLGLPKFVSGDMVAFVDWDRSFRVTTASVSEHPEYGYTWTYRFAGYFVPEQDLHLVSPRGVK